MKETMCAGWSAAGTLRRQKTQEQQFKYKPEDHRGGQAARRGPSWENGADKLTKTEGEVLNTQAATTN